MSSGSPKQGQKPMFPDPIPPTLTGALIFLPPIEIHCDSDHISLFHRNNFIRLKEYS